MKRIADRIYSIIFKRTAESNWESGLCFEGYDNWIVDSEGKNPKYIYDTKIINLINIPINSAFKELEERCKVFND